MGFRLSKSIKMGGMRVNLSRSGIGMSTGIKGLRVGVNSRGKTYVSGGRNGIYFRETLSSGSSSRKQQNELSNENAAFNRGCLLAVLGFVFLIFSFSFPILFLIPLSIVGFLIIKALYNKSNQNKVSNLIDRINSLSSFENNEELQVVLESVGSSFSNTEYSTKVYEQTYRTVLEKIVEDNAVSEDELKIIKAYEQQLPQNKYQEINSNVIDEIVSNILEDSHVSEDENTYINNILSLLPVSDEKKSEVNNAIEEMKKIEIIRTNGLQPIEVISEFTTGKDCYYASTVEVFKVRQSKGEQYYELETTADIFITNDSIDIISDGNKKIRIKNIIKAELQGGMIEIIVTNRQKPICIKSKEPLLIIAIIGELKKVC
jgi:transcriptional regulator NrdR family protein